MQAARSSTEEIAPSTNAGVTSLMGKRKPVTLVRTVTARKNAVHPPRPAFENSPPTTMKPANIAIMLITTCSTVNCSSVKPKIMVQLPSQVAECKADEDSKLGREAALGTRRQLCDLFSVRPRAKRGPRFLVWWPWMPACAGTNVSEGLGQGFQSKQQ